MLIPHMLPQQRIIFKSNATNTAHKGSLSGMFVHVFFERNHLYESFVAHITFIRTLSSVDHHMPI